MSKKPIAKSPITWVAFQSIMRDFGYEMERNSPDRKGVIFKSKDTTAELHTRSPVTIKYPDCVANDGQTPVYEKDYVIDLLKDLTGQNGSESIAKIIANRTRHA